MSTSNNKCKQNCDMCCCAEASNYTFDKDSAIEYIKALKFISDTEYSMMRAEFAANGTDSAYDPEVDDNNLQSQINGKVAKAAAFLAKRKMQCNFCLNNGERELVYNSHNLKDEYGRVCCPVLRNYTCPICKLTGDFAHTVKYCPFHK